MTTTLLIAGLLLLAGVSGAGVALTREPRRQAAAASANGLVLTLLFMALQAPDVALSELAVGTVAVPLLILGALTSIRTDRPPSDKDE